jgi:hypothetical protein
VQCPRSSGNNFVSNCTLGNITAENVGVTNFTTNLDPQPLTWTIGQSENSSVSPSVVGRDFYLGQPPSLNIQNLSGTPDCAIFFHGIAPSLKFPSPVGDQLGSSGTCADALTAPCVEALQDQITVMLATNATLDCGTIAAVLQSAAPPSCPVQNGNWGQVSGKRELDFIITQVLLLINLAAISGADAPGPLPLSDCHPTTGINYSLTHIDGVSSSPLQTGTVPYDDFVFGITPILTVLRNTTNSKSETHLTCLKAITTQASGSQMISGSPIIAPDLASGYSALVALWLLSFL